MSTLSVPRPSRWAPVALLLVIGVQVLSAASDAATPAVSKEGTPASGDLVVVPSTFVDNPEDPKFGKDIFFPGTRRFIKKTDTPSTQTPVQQTETAVTQSLVLKGVSGSGVRRFALINNRTLGVGEVWDYKLNGQTYRVRCEEIRPRSVLITIEGMVERKEIQLRGGL